MKLRRMRAAWLSAVLACLLALVDCGGSATSASVGGGGAGSDSSASASAGAGESRVAPAPGADWSMFDFDPQRSGVGPARTGIGIANLRQLTPRIVTIDGTVDSSPVELHAVRVRGRRRDVIFVTTSYGHTIAIDPGTGQRLWEYTPASIGVYQGSDQVTTATPVIGSGRQYVYATSPDGLIHKLSVANGAEVRSAHWPVRVTYDPTKEKLASALNISGGSLIAATGGYYGDAQVYQGHVALIDLASGRITHVFNALCSNRAGLIDPPDACPQSDAAVWSRAGVVVEPGSGRLLLATGNGDFNGSTDWGDSVLELSPSAHLLHNWTPPNQAELAASDTDLGSSAPALLPPVGGRHLLVQGAKDQRLHVLDLGRLNGTQGGASRRVGGELGELASPGQGQVMTAPVVWSHGGRAYVFVADDSGTAAYIAGGGRHPGLSLAWQNATAGTSPVLAGGLLYVYDEVDGTLEVYSPTSGARLVTLQASRGHWNSPVVVGRRIILPVGSYHDHAGRGQIYIWHLPGR